MTTLRRLAEDESGMTMGLVIMMILLIGVMGAGLLTFVSRDLNTVVEVNQGQRAFELADSGVQAAKRQLNSDFVADHYDGGSGDIQWSADPAKGGLTLNNLDGISGTTDSVNVTIQYRSATTDFLVISTGSYGEARRKIEAILEEIGSGGGGGLHIPVYYTPSDIKIKVSPTEFGVTLRGMSMFTEQNILIQNLATPGEFRTDFENNKGPLTVSQGVQDELGNWDSRSFANPGTWNTQRRIKFYDPNPSSDYTRAGLAAEGKICGFTNASTGTCSSTSASIADGVYGYDSTTGTKGNGLTFVEKTPPDKNPNDPDTITYPFPRPSPDAAALKELAQSRGTYYKGTNPDWNALFPNASGSDRVVFIDAEGSTLNYSTSNSGNNKGILVVWCGELVMNQSFQGIIFTLNGNELPGNTSCGSERGLYRSAGQDFSGWLYSEGGTATRAGIELDPGSSVNKLPAGDWDLLDLAFGTTTGVVELQSWRELYQ